MNDREQIVKKCFNSWIIKDVDVFRNCFADDVSYFESWGPAYKTVKHIVNWFNDWTSENAVLEWSIKEFFHTKNECICEWYFKCECGGAVHDFNGVSIIKFNDANKIVLLKEFQSKTPNSYPYEC